MRRLFIALSIQGLILAAAVSLLADTAADTRKVAMLLPGSINDQSWNSSGYKGLMKLKATGWSTAYSEKRSARGRS
ncbi:MAG: hypothetical protein WDO18_21845 [Acidobacteriota bacterium]